MARQPRSSISPLRAGLACRCPNCGCGRLFTGFLTVVRRCEVCGEDLAACEQGDGPAVFVMTILGFIVVAAALVVEVRFAPPFWVHALIWVPAIIFGTALLMRPLKGVLVAMHFRHRRGEVERG